MKRYILSMLLVVAAGLGMTTIYSVEPVDATHSAFVHSATQDMIATADSIMAADVFLGHPRTGGFWIAQVDDGHGHYQEADVAARDSLKYSFVHFVFSPPLPARKGTKCWLTIYHSLDSSAEVFWNPNDVYAYGQMTLESGSFKPPPWPPPNSNSDLCARITGVVYNNTDMIGFWDEIPHGLCDKAWREARYGTPYRSQEDEYVKLIEAAAKMADLGVTVVRICDQWHIVQPDSGNQDSLVWSCGMDSCWSIFASHGIHPHLIGCGSGKFELCTDYRPFPLWSCPFPRGLFYPVLDGRRHRKGQQAESAWVVRI